jgi:hypothetical protein
LNPEVPRLVNLLYPPLPDIQTTGRNDLVTVLLTGVPGLNNPGTGKQADLLRKTVTLVRTHYPYAKLLVWYLVRDESPTSYWRSGLATFDWQEKPAYGLYKVLAGL